MARLYVKFMNEQVLVYNKILTPHSAELRCIVLRTHAFYSRDAGLELSPKTWLRFSVVFLSASRKISR
jgi:hypothetical protein